MGLFVVAHFELRVVDMLEEKSRCARLKGRGHHITHTLHRLGDDYLNSKHTCPHSAHQELTQEEPSNAWQHHTVQSHPRILHHVQQCDDVGPPTEVLKDLDLTLDLLLLNRLQVGGGPAHPLHTTPHNR